MRNNSLYFRPALYAGLILAIINFAPGLFFVNMFCCAGLWIGGVLAVLFFRMDVPKDYAIQNIDGFYLGLWSGIFGAGFETVLDIAIGPYVTPIKFQEVKSFIEKLSSGQEFSTLLQQLNQAIAAAKSPGLIDFLGSFALYLIVYSVFTIFAALLTTAFMQKRKANTQ